MDIVKKNKDVSLLKILEKDSYYKGKFDILKFPLLYIIDKKSLSFDFEGVLLKIYENESEAQGYDAKLSIKQ